MPMKPKFTKEEIIDKALDYVSKYGIEALTARELGKCLGSSACPIFTVFENMEEVVKEVKKKAFEKYNNYVGKAFDYYPAFKQIGILMVNFAKEEPKIFKLLFMTESDEEFDITKMITTLGDLKDECLKVIMYDYSLTYDDAYLLFEHLWIYSYGLAALSATKKCNFSNEVIMDMLGTTFFAMVTLIKSGKHKIKTPVPMPKNEAKDVKSFLEVYNETNKDGNN